MIERVHVDGRIQLAQQIAYRDANWLPIFGENKHEVQKAIVLDFCREKLTQDCAIDSVKELSDVKFDDVRAGRALAKRGLRVIGCAMGAFAFAAGKSLVDQRGVVDRTYNAVDGVLHHQISEGRGVDRALLWLVDLECGVRLRLVCAAMQFAVQRIEVFGQTTREFQASAPVMLVATGRHPGFIKRFSAECVLEKKPATLHGATPRRSTAAKRLLGKGQAADFAPRIAAQRRKTSPLAPPSVCTVRGESESERNPMLSLEFDRELFQFKAHTPALEELFQLPPEIGHMLRRLPLREFFIGDPAADHPPKFIDHPANGQIAMLSGADRALLRLGTFFETEVA